jgi:NTE family protein
MKKLNTLLLGGGGIKGLSYLGVFKYIEELQRKIQTKSNKKNESTSESTTEESITSKLATLEEIDIKKIIGVSVGSIYAMFYIMGYTSEQLLEEVMLKNFNDIIDVSLSNFLKNYGLDSGNFVISWIETLMIKAGYKIDITFRELYERTQIHFDILAVDLTKNETKYFNYKTEPDMKITTAIRLSISIPFVYSLKYYKEVPYIDYGLIHSCPIDLYEEHDNIIAIFLKSKNSKHQIIKKIDSLQSYINNVFSYILSTIKDINDYKKVITVELDIASMKFDLDDIKKIEIINAGYNSTKRFFEN